MLFFRDRKKIDPRRRFGSKAFRDKIKAASSYKRVFRTAGLGWREQLIYKLGLQRKSIRYLLAIIFLVAVYYLVIADTLRVKEIVLSGNNQISKETFEQVMKEEGNRRLFLVPKDHILLLSRGRFEDMVKRRLVQISEIIKYRRIWPDKIEVEINERSPSFVLKIKETSFVVDDSGLIIREATDQDKLPLVLDQVEEEVKIGQQLTNVKLVGFIISMNKSWPTKISVPIKEAKVPGIAASEAQFVTSEGWGVFFDVNRSVASQLSNLSLLLSRQIPAKDRNRLAYIDLKLPKWAYYCFKNTPCSSVAQPTEEEIKP